MKLVCFSMCFLQKSWFKKKCHQGCAYFVAVNAAILSSANLCDIALIGTASQQWGAFKQQTMLNSLHVSTFEKRLLRIQESKVTMNSSGMCRAQEIWWKLFRAPLPKRYSGIFYKLCFRHLPSRPSLWSNLRSQHEVAWWGLFHVPSTSLCRICV